MAKFLSKDGKFYMRDGKLLGYTPPSKASLTPQTGITYTSGLSGIDSAEATPETVVASPSHSASK